MFYQIKNMFIYLYSNIKTTFVLTISSGFGSGFFFQLQQFITSEENLKVASSIGVWAGMVSAVVGMVVISCKGAYQGYKWLKGK